MKEFSIMIHSLQDVQDFVAISQAQPFEVFVGNEGQSIDGKDFMGMFSLDYRFPQRVRADCPGEAFFRFRQEVSAFVVE